MTQLGKKHYPYEFGGILVGIKFDNCWIVVDVETPTDFESKGNTFVRGVNSLNGYLQQIFSESHGNIEYLGEWHTHPSGSIQFSNQDEISIKSIAETPSSGNSEPILCILSISKKEFYQFYQLFENQILKLN